MLPLTSSFVVFFQLLKISVSLFIPIIVWDFCLVLFWLFRLKYCVYFLLIPTPRMSDAYIYPVPEKIIKADLEKKLYVGLAPASLPYTF